MKDRFFLSVCALIFPIQTFAQTDTAERMNRNRYGGRDTASYQVGDSVYNQGTTGNRPGMDGYQAGKQSADMHGSGFVMRNGKMMLMKNGMYTGLNSDTTLNNGTRIMRNGNIVMKNGTQRMLKEGEYVNMGGNIMPMNRGNEMRDYKDMNREYKDQEKNNMNKGDMNNDTSRTGNTNMNKTGMQNKTRSYTDTTIKKKSDMYLVPDSARKNYEKKK